MAVSPDDLVIFPPAETIEPPARERVRAPASRAGWGWLVRLPAWAGEIGSRVAVWVLGALLPAAIFGLWWLTAERQWIAEQILPAPAYVWESFALVWDSGELIEHLTHSARRVGLSLLLGGGAGLLLGAALGLSPALRTYVLPTLRALAQVPILGWIPLLIIFVGIEEGLKLWAISLAVAVPVTFTTLDAIANIPKALLEVGRVHQFSPLQVLHRIVLPAALPGLFTAVRQGVMQAWLTVIFVELLSSSEGLGFFMAYSRSLAQIDMVVVSMFAIGAAGVLIDIVLRLIESRLQGWRRTAY